MSLLNDNFVDNFNIEDQYIEVVKKYFRENCIVIKSDTFKINTQDIFCGENLIDIINTKSADQYMLYYLYKDVPHCKDTVFLCFLDTGDKSMCSVFRYNKWEVALRRDGPNDISSGYIPVTLGHILRKVHYL